MAQLTAWKTVKAAEVVSVDEGDILLPLKRVSMEYVRRAIDLEHRAFGEKAAAIRKVAATYRECAVNIDNLIHGLAEENIEQREAELLASFERVIDAVPGESEFVPVPTSEA